MIFKRGKLKSVIDGINALNTTSAADIIKALHREYMGIEL